MSHVRHIVAFSGGKDSSALAIYLHNPEHWRKTLGKICERPRIPLDNAEYVFCDTGTELDETYNYLDQLEAYLGKPIQRLRANVPPSKSHEDDKTPFDHYLELYGGLLPSPNMRWCTRMLKLKPFEYYIGEDEAVNYVGIRADEKREGYISTKPNITTVFPFREDGINKEDVYRILEDSGVGVPEYYSWRSRSGCYFCFFQRRSEWVGLLENHPHLFEKAKRYEKTDSDTGERYTWSDTESLDELAKPGRISQIKHRVEENKAKLLNKPSKRLINRNDLLGERDEWEELDDLRDLEDNSVGCNICHL